MPRTLEIAIAEVRYGAEYGSLNERFWTRIDTAMNVVQMVSGALALAGALKSPALTAAAGVVLAVISGLQLSLQPLRRAIEFRDAKRAFHDLNARAPALTLEQMDAELERLRGAAPQGLSAFAMPALNIVNARHGHDKAYDLKWNERLAMWFA